MFNAVILLHLLVLASVSLPASASSAKAFDLGSFKVTPTLAIDSIFTDNLHDSDDEKVETWQFRVAPKISFKQQDQLNTYTLSYQIEDVHHTDLNNDDHLNHFLDADVFLDLDVRHRLGLNAGFNALHEERGTDFSLGYGEILKEPTAYYQSSFGSNYSYGAKSALANIDVYFKYNQVNYETLNLDDLNVDLGIDPSDPRLPIDLNQIDLTRDRDYQSYNLGGTFFYDSQAFTRVNLEIGSTEFDYDSTRLVNGSLDSTQSYIYVGAEWDGTAMTTGFVKLGYDRKDFDDDQTEDSSGFRWKLGVLFSPLTYSNFDFSTAKEVSETKGLSDYIENTNYTVTWHHQWLERLASKVYLSRNDDNYGGSDREDENLIISGSLDYQMRRNMTITATYTNVDRTSNYQTFEYQGNTLNLAMTLSF